MKVFHYTEIKAEDAGEGSSKLSIRWLITKDLGAENFAMRLFEMEPGGYSPLHTHPWEHEVFILEGEGIVTDGQNTRRLGVGDVIFVPPNERHQFRNIGSVTLKFLCVTPHKDNR